MKYIQLFFAAVFFYFVTLQFNDPDPMGWIMIYGFASIASVLTAFDERRPYFRYALMGAIAISVIWMATLLPEFIHWIEIGAPSILSEWAEGSSLTEMVREFLGLVICTAIFGYYASVYVSRTEREEMQNAMA